jgi:hypothetical protein
VETDRYILMFQRNLLPPSSVAGGGSRFSVTSVPDNMLLNSRRQGTSDASCHFYLLCFSPLAIEFDESSFLVSGNFILSIFVHKF